MHARVSNQIQATHAIGTAPDRCQTMRRYRYAYAGASILFVITASHAEPQFEVDCQPLGIAKVCVPPSAQTLKGQGHKHIQIQTVVLIPGPASCWMSDVNTNHPCENWTGNLYLSRQTISL